MQDARKEMRREPVRTTLSIEIFVRAIVAAWDASWGKLTASFVAMIWAKYITETSNKHCYNWNIGNVKDVIGDGFDFHCLRGVWEGVTKAAADSLIASGQARLDENEVHKAAVFPKIAVVFEPPHPATRFRSYDNLAQAMAAHLAFLRKHYPKAFEAAHGEDVPAFVRALAGYATASGGAYVANMAPTFASAMRTVPTLLAEAEVLAGKSEAPGVDVDVEEAPGVEPIPVIHGTHVVEAALEGRRANLGEDLA